MNKKMWIYCVVFYLLSVFAPYAFRVTPAGNVVRFSWGLYHQGVMMFNIWGMAVTLGHFYLVLYPTFSLFSRWCKGPSSSRVARKLVGFEILLLVVFFTGVVVDIVTFSFVIIGSAYVLLAPLLWFDLITCGIIIYLLVEPVLTRNNDYEDGAAVDDYPQNVTHIDSFGDITVVSLDPMPPPKDLEEQAKKEADKKRVKKPKPKRTKKQKTDDD